MNILIGGIQSHSRIIGRQVHHPNYRKVNPSIQPSHQEVNEQYGDELLRHKDGDKELYEELLLAEEKERHQSAVQRTVDEEEDEECLPVDGICLDNCPQAVDVLAEEGAVVDERYG